MSHDFRVSLREVGLESANEVQAIIDAAPIFSENVEGVTHDPEYARRDLQALPPGCDKDQKHFFIIQNAGTNIGVADLVRDYPKPGTTFLGLLLLAEFWQGKGAGRAAYQLLEDFAETKLSARKLRLAYNDTNPVGTFWEKMGFKLTGETKAYKGQSRDSNVHLMEKDL